MIPQSAENLTVALIADATGPDAERVKLTALGSAGEVLDTLTPRAWDARARAVAHALLQIAEPGDRVVVPVLGGLDFHIGFMGCLYAGMIAVPVPNPWMRATGKAGARTHERLASICKDCEPRAVLVNDKTPENGLSALAGIQRVSVSKVSSAPDFQVPSLALAPDAIALIQYTSGSTAEPKGTIITHANWVLNRRDTRDRAEVGPDTTVVTWLPLFHDMGIGNGLVLPLISGARLAIMEPNTFVRSPLVWLRAIAERGDVFNSAPDFAFHMCVDRTTEAERRALDLSGWRTVVNGSEPVRIETIDRFTQAFAVSGLRRETMRPAYGLAECTLGVTMGEAQSPVVVRTYRREVLAAGRAEPCMPSGASVALIGCGTPSAQVMVLIVDPTTRRALPERRVGEIWVRSPCNARGYWNRSAETTTTFHARLAEVDDRRPFLRTGDLGFLDDGELFITGRIKDVLILGGQNYYPQDAEAVARRAHPAFENQVCAAWALDDAARESLAVVVETDERDGEVLAEATRSAAIAVAGMVPFPVVAVAVPRYQVPRTTSGKIRRRECAKQLLEGLIPVLHRWAPQ